QADRRPDVREGPGGHALLDLQHRRVRRLHPRQARDHRGDPGQHEADPRRDPVRRLRARVDRREPRQPGELPAHARRAGGQAGRVGRSRAAVAHGLDQAELLTRATSPRGSLMLAYVFWHAPAAGVAPETYAAAIDRFHRSIAARPPAGFVRSACLRADGLSWFEQGAGFEDWYVVEDFAAIGVLNAAAIGRGHLTAHDAAARHAGPGTGSIYRL